MPYCAHWASQGCDFTPSSDYSVPPAVCQNERASAIRVVFHYDRAHFGPALVAVRSPNKEHPVPSPSRPIRARGRDRNLCRRFRKHGRPRKINIRAVRLHKLYKRREKSQNYGRPTKLQLTRSRVGDHRHFRFDFG